ncbi:30S ribosomal protein S1 [Candidatus Desantisbacteria bacterium CG_4_10_14_0_8_um_filter_39_17]|uniref:30S ribosomal protein S1 n=1 Tax=Candidatus Desantisbacteria bacterium CG_4_10_14_0_8_um_filter_39_17 TaxID=1974542 RepID=A0A2H9PCV0_9BACT|nr:MAG: 30S ribosomal protein S1 [Candidatus Desantisbacteria bacterium CG_4_10_14_0_8_um_filter_39_17]
MDSIVNLNKEYEETMGRAKDLKEGSIIKGKVVHIGKEEILVDIGYKSEGIIPISEFYKKGKKVLSEIKNGDEIDVFLLDKEDESGKMFLSYEKAVLILVWERIVHSFEKNESINGKVTGVCKNTAGKISGFTIDVDGIKGFLPFSASEMKKSGDFNQYIGKKMELKIIELDKKKHDVVFSRKALLDEMRKKQKEAFFKSLKVGEVREGVVSTLTPFGAFINLGGIDGLVHLNDLSWGRRKPEELLKKGDRIKVKILDFNEDEDKISLGIRQLKPDPWNEIEKKYPVGTKVKAGVMKIAPFGVFVEIDEGIEGLVRLEDLSWKRTIKHPSELVKEEDELDLVVIFLNVAEKKLALGLKQIQSDPWFISAQKYAPGTKVKGKIVKLTSFGAFVRLEEGIDGLIRLKDIRWDDKVKHPSEVFSRGKEVEAVVLSVDKENKKIALGAKQLINSPWDKYKKGVNVKGKVIKMDDFGASVQLEDGMEGFIHVSELSKNYVSKPEEVISPGQVLDLKVIKVNPKQKKIELSLKQFIEDQEKHEISHFINSQEKDTVTLGDLLKREKGDRLLF